MIEASIYQRIRADLLRNRNVVLAGEVVWGPTDNSPFRSSVSINSSVEEVVELYIAPVHPLSIKKSKSIRRYEDGVDQFAEMVLDGLRDAPIKDRKRFTVHEGKLQLGIMEFNETIGMKILRVSDTTAIWDKLAERTGEIEEGDEMQRDLYRRIYISPFPNAGLAWMVALNEEQKKKGGVELPFLDRLSEVDGFFGRWVDRAEIENVLRYKGAFEAIANFSSKTPNQG
jgi:hypothetical protein